MVNPARLRAIAIGGTRGRGSKNDGPAGSDIVSRLSTEKNKTSTYSFPMNGSESSKYPANTMPKDQVTPGKWTTKNKICK